MTPEQAREIDRLEFDADCRAARERVADMMEERSKSYRVWFRGLSKQRPAIAEAFMPERLPHRRPERVLTYNGKSLTVAQWSNVTGMSTNTIGSRIRMGWPIERILTEPVARKRRTKAPKVIEAPVPPATWGVPSDFSDQPTTDARRTARDFSQLEFS